MRINYLLFIRKGTMYRIHFKRKLFAIFLVFILAFTVISRPAASQEGGQPSIAAKTAKVTPSDVFVLVDLLNRSLDVMLDAGQIKQPQPTASVEKGLGPMHVYQLAVACVNRIYDFDIQINIRPIPQVIVRPMKYTPADVKPLLELMLGDIWRAAFALKINDLPEEEGKFSDKSPTDVFQGMLNLFIKLSALTRQENIDPNTVFSEISRAVTDVKSILSQIDPVCRFKVNPPAGKPGLKPADVFAECLNARRVINKYRQEFNMNIVPVPQLSAVSLIRSVDVYVQTQIIIAEVNLLKMATNTISSTPLAIPSAGKTPSDVHQQAVMIQYLLNQINTLKDIVAQD